MHGSGVPAPPHASLPPWEVMSQENNGSAVTPQPTSKTSLGLIKRKLWLPPWMSARASTEDG